MKSTAAKMTYELYRLLPDDGKRYELIDGELMMMTPAPTPRHQRIAGNLFSELRTHVKANNLGEVFIAPVDVVLEEHTVVEPDILFVSRERQGIVREEAIHGAPDVVVEILSPSSFYHDLRRKMALYSQFGVQEYWIVDPEKQAVDLYVRAGNELKLARQFASHESFESPLLPGFRLAVSGIFS
jgi:Uma2 family endonuclease